jgi:hypothetical protein
VVFGFSGVDVSWRWMLAFEPVRPCLLKMGKCKGINKFNGIEMHVYLPVGMKVALRIFCGQGSPRVKLCKGLVLEDRVFRVDGYQGDKNFCCAMVKSVNGMMSVGWFVVK